MDTMPGSDTRDHWLAKAVDALKCGSKNRTGISPPDDVSFLQQIGSNS